MEQEKIIERMEVQEQKLDAIYKRVNQLYKVFLVTLFLSIVMFVLPLIGLIFVIPWALGAIGGAYSGLL